MRIAVLSGKGGTGKTTVSACLSAVITPSQYVDCDVEEPNGYIFLKPDIKQSYPVYVEIPYVDESVCTGCGACAKACQFHALAVIRKKVLLFAEICHHCGACFIACKPGAITSVERNIGVVETNGECTFAQGKLNIGEPVSVPVIRELKKHLREDIPVILDCPPGASCSVIQSLEGSDFCLLVTEPTPFGLHDLKIAVSLVKKLCLPFGVIINKALDSNSLIEDYCKSEDIDIMMKIPFSKHIAESYSAGILPVYAGSGWADDFRRLYESIKERVSQ